MSTKLWSDYPLAPLEVRSSESRPIDVEVRRDGSIEILVEADDLGSFTRATVELYYQISAEDWTAVVEHVRRDQLYAAGMRQAEVQVQECDRTTVCVLDRGHSGQCQRPGGVKVVTTVEARQE